MRNSAVDFFLLIFRQKFRFLIQRKGETENLQRASFVNLLLAVCAFDRGFGCEVDASVAHIACRDFEKCGERLEAMSSFLDSATIRPRLASRRAQLTATGKLKL